MPIGMGKVTANKHVIKENFNNEGVFLKKL